MRLLAASAAGLSVYLLVGLLTGQVPGGTGSRRHRSRGVAAFLREAGLTATPLQFVGVSVSLSLVTFVVIWALAGAVPVAVIPALAAGTIPWAWFSRHRRRLRRDRQTAWPDALRHLVASLEVPMSLHRALVELGRSGPEPLRDVFTRYEITARLDHTAALQAIRHELSDPLADRVVEVLLVAQSKGNRVVIDILRDLAEHTAADVRLDEDIETANLEKRIEARSAVVLPFAVLVLLCSSSQAYREFYSTPRGALVIALGALMAFIGMTIISRLGRLPTEPRVLVVDDRGAGR